MKKDLLLLLHDGESTPGSTTEWCDSRKISYRIENAAKLGWFHDPSADDYRGVIIFGGNMQAWEEDKHPWLRKEKRLICDFVGKGKGAFGVCLGVQLLADCQGGEAYPLGRWHIGWDPCTAGAQDLMPLHWHSSGFKPPPGASLLAWDKEGLSLGYRSSPLVLGYQFHTEINAKRLEEALQNWKPNLDGRVATPEQIRNDAERNMAALKAWYFRELDAWWKELPK
jgi:GMP synthase-like glutamine amidotransferase